ncbi:hypothetical protein VTN77DRAFT_5726 [Rasamsonia byssochlamydoides]|uniref:uncharacterized protein n=1 Tax=Rasamsonia byssochlamydoides TaxID=89139 RepID=UPI003742DCEA
MEPHKGIPLVRRYITAHDRDGAAVFLSASQVPECAPNRSAGDNGEVALLYATDSFPAQLDEEADVALYDSYLHTPPGLTPEQGTVMRIVDMRPQKETPMHRTVSLDYGVVLEGEVELVLDSGQSRVMRRGDVSIQRATAHSYRNRSETDWCRLLFVYLPVQQPLEVAGRRLKEEWYDQDQEDRERGEEQSVEAGGGEQEKQEQEKQELEKQEGEKQEGPHAGEKEEKGEYGEEKQEEEKQENRKTWKRILGWKSRR